MRGMKKQDRIEAAVLTVKKESGEDWTQALLRTINEETAVVAIPHCHWTDGGLIDLRNYW